MIYDVNIQAGRQALAKELYAMQGQKIDANVLLNVCFTYLFLSFGWIEIQCA